MSFDLAVWYPHTRLSDQEAGELYGQLCNGDISSLKPHPSLEAFYKEITAIHPEIDNVPDEKVDDVDYCPWSIAFDRSNSHLIMCAVWSKAEYVAQLVLDLAQKHRLAVFSPQANAIEYPDDGDA